jgi:3-oxoacyl-[acyl-carrier-protein] synthase II
MMGDAMMKDKIQGRPVVAVTGIGIVTSLGVGKAENWAKLSKGESGIRQISRFDTGGLRTTIAGTVDVAGEGPFSCAGQAERLAEMAAREAVGDAALGRSGDFPGPLFVGMPPVDVEWRQREILADACPGTEQLSYDDLLAAASTGRFHSIYERSRAGSIADCLAERFGTKGIPVSVTTACASGATAIQLGVDAIRRGEAQAALCVGTDGSVSPESLVRFSLLSALSTRNDPPEAASRPFCQDRDGFVMGEAAGALVLEDLHAAKARGARIFGLVKGCGETADPFHRTRSSPDGKPMIACMAKAIADADLDPGEIEYVNAHGTGTPENDKMEHLAMASVFGSAMPGIPVSSTKSMTGHALSAAGTIEAIFTLLTLEHQRILPTINYRKPDPAIPLDVVPNHARDVRLSHAMSNSFGFGGQNVSLVFGTA